MRRGTKGAVDTAALATLPLWFAIFLFSTTCHEAAHALVARMGGDATAHEGGQAGLDPIPHIRRSPIGMVVVPLLSFFLNGGRWMIGWASAPYDPVWAARYPRRAGWMALSGPGANLLLAVVTGVIIYAGVSAGWLAVPDRATADHVVALPGQESGLASLALSVAFNLNLLLFAFNLLPIPPLDGGAAIALLLPRHLFEKWRDLTAEPMVAVVGLIGAWHLFGYVWPSVFRFALGVLHPGHF